MEVCIGCRQEFEPFDGPTGHYGGASAGCWNVYTEILAREYNNPSYMAVHKYTVDTYCLQHPIDSSDAARQSINVHLLSLYLMISEAKPHDFVNQVMQQVTKEHKHQFEWLEPPRSEPTMTIKDVYKAKDATEHKNIVMSWAGSELERWGEHVSSVALLAKKFLD